MKTMRMARDITHQISRQSGRNQSDIEQGCVAASVEKESGSPSLSRLNEIRVYFEDTDVSGRTYHASYLQFLQRGRTEWPLRLGFWHSEIAEVQARIAYFVVRELQIEYLAPTLMDNL